MASKTATATFALTYTDASGTSVKFNKTVTSGYDSLEEGVIEIPLGATAGYTNSVAFGSVTSASGLLFVNSCGQELQVRINGVTGDHHVPDGGVLLEVIPTKAGSAPISSFTVSGTTAQAADGSYQYLVLGPL